MLANVVELLEWTRARSLPEALVWCLLVNVAVFAAALAIGALLVRAFRHAPIAGAPLPVSREELWLATLCVLGNTLVMFVGWLLFRAGWLKVAAGAGFLPAFADAFILLFAMDFAMYVTHRIAHHPIAFRYVHGVHHRYERVRP